MARPIGVITALADEATALGGLAEHPDLRCRRAGIGVARAGETARLLVAEGCRALVSFGIAGGLDPIVPSGGIILAHEVFDQSGRRHVVAAEWRDGIRTRLAGLGDSVFGGGILTVAELVASPAVKAELRARFGAVAVDMESSAIAAVAHDAGLPFLALRAVADPAHRGLPPWLAGDVIDADGRPRLGRLLCRIVGDPGSIRRLIRLAGDQRRAVAALRRVAALVGPGVGLGL